MLTACLVNLYFQITLLIQLVILIQLFYLKNGHVKTLHF